MQTLSLSLCLPASRERGRLPLSHAPSEQQAKPTVDWTLRNGELNDTFLIKSSRMHARTHAYARTHARASVQKIARGSTSPIYHQKWLINQGFQKGILEYFQNILIVVIFFQPGVNVQKVSYVCVSSKLQIHITFLWTVSEAMLEGEAASEAIYTPSSLVWTLIAAVSLQRIAKRLFFKLRKKTGL